MTQADTVGMRRRGLLAGAVGLGAAALCAPVVRAAGDKVVRMWSQFDPTSGRDPREKVLAKLIAGFQAENPGVRIVAEPQIWYQIADKFFAAHRTGTSADIVTLNYARVPAAIDLGSLAPLDPLMGKLLTADDYADMSGPYQDFGTKDGMHYQIEHSRSVAGITYRSDLFRQAGIDAASVTTWDAFLQAAQTLTVRDGGQVTRYGFGQVFTQAANQPSVAASIMMDRNHTLFGDGGKASFANAAGVEGMTFQTDLIRKYNVAPASAISLSGEDLYDVFTSGRAAMILNNSARLARLRGIIKSNDVEFFPFPSFTAGKASPTEAQGWPFTVWSGSKVKDEAAKFIAYISSRDADRMWTLEGGAIPIRKSTITGNPGFFKDPANAYIVRVADVMQNAVWFVPKTPVGGWNEALDKAAQSVLGNGTAVDAALRRAERDYNDENGL